MRAGTPETGDVAAAARSVSLHVVLLRAADVAPRPTWVKSTLRRRVVFMHGWWQDHTSWLTTAQRVREKFGHDCLLLDWPGHGLSETPRADVMGADLLLAALRRTLERVGWADGATPLTLCGCSLGGAIAMRYTSTWPATVDRLVLIAPAGFDEKRPTLIFRFLTWLGSHVVDAAPASAEAEDAPAWPKTHWLLQQLRLVRTTPRYDAELDWFQTAAARRPIRIVCATHDELHNAYLWAGGRRADPTFRLTFFCANHGLLCVSIARLKLWEDAENWHGEAVPSSKL